MYAYRRANVAELNRRGREVWRALGRLEGPEHLAPGGIRYAVGDRVVTLTPAAGARVVTSETGMVVAVRPEEMALSIRMDDDNEIRKLVGPEIGADRLALGYAVTVHRSQESTVERAHALEDGGDRPESPARCDDLDYVVAGCPARRYGADSDPSSPGNRRPVNDQPRKGTTT